MMQDREYELAHPYYPKPIAGGGIMGYFDKNTPVDEFGKAMRGRKRSRGCKGHGKRKR